MTHKLDRGEQLKIKDIIQKLKNLECPLIVKEEDAWVAEILFKPNFDRYRLMEWIFSKLEFSISKKLDFCIPEEDEFQNSSEVKVKNLLNAISSLGLCNKNRSDIIEGEAPFRDQLDFWKSLVDILWKKCSCSYNISKAGPSLSSKGPQSIIEQYEAQTKYLSKLYESVNFNLLFKEKMDLFPTYLLKESEGITSVSSKFSNESLNELKILALKNSNSDDFKELLIKDVFDESEVNATCSDSIIYDEESLDKLEDEIFSSLSELERHIHAGFNDAYKNLKLYLDVPTDESIDVGPSFEAAKLELNRFLKLKNALATLKSSESELKTLNADFQSLEISGQLLPDSLLREYMAVLNDKNKNPTK